MFCQMNPFKNMSFNQKKSNQWATLSSLMSVSLNKITKTLMNFRSSRNTFTISSTCLENLGFSELWRKYFTYFLPGCHLLQSPVCQRWWTVGKVFISVQKIIFFKKYLTSQCLDFSSNLIFWALLPLVLVTQWGCQAMVPSQHKWPWSPAHSSAPRFQSEGQLFEKAPWNSLEKILPPGNCGLVPPKHWPGWTCLLE